jgi:hypothetical protein
MTNVHADSAINEGPWKKKTIHTHNVRACWFGGGSSCTHVTGSSGGGQARIRQCSGNERGAQIDQLHTTRAPRFFINSANITHIRQVHLLLGPKLVLIMSTIVFENAYK